MLNRRDFLAASASAAAALVVCRPSAKVAPSNRVTAALIGAGNVGSGHLGMLLENPGCQVVAVCDVDASRRENAARRVEHVYACTTRAASFHGCDARNDFREVLARRDIDAVLVAVPDHWHSLISLAAVRAGKDVYCEKPLTLSIREGRTLTDAVRQLGRILQTGNHYRSDPRFRQTCAEVRSGALGQLRAIAIELPARHAAAPAGMAAAEPIPGGFDYDLWLGPAPFQPYHRLRCHYFFRHLLEYSGGPLTNQAAHWIDLAQGAMGMDRSGPVEVEARGRFDDDPLYTAPRQIDFAATYSNGVTLQVRTAESCDSAIQFDGSESSMRISLAEMRASDSRRHWANFLDSIRTRTQPVCNAEVGHRSATVCHLGNIAMRLGRRLRWDPASERFIDDADANRMTDRPLRSPWHL